MWGIHIHSLEAIYDELMLYIQNYALHPMFPEVKEQSISIRELNSMKHGRLPKFGSYK